MLQTKRCSKCKEIKLIDNFCRDKYCKDGYHGVCRGCIAEYSKRYYLDNSEKVKEKSRKWSKDNPNKTKKRFKKWLNNNAGYNKERTKKWREDNFLRAKATSKEWRKNNYERYVEIKREWEINNPEKVKKTRKRGFLKWFLKPKNNLSTRVASSIRKSIKRNKNGYHWENLVNYTIQDLMAHLEKQFKPSMNWELFAQGKIHIDHIIPVSLWEFNSYEDREFKQCWALCNLQPLWAIDNLTKGAKI